LPDDDPHQIPRLTARMVQPPSVEYRRVRRRSPPPRGRWLARLVTAVALVVIGAATAAATFWYLEGRPRSQPGLHQTASERAPVSAPVTVPASNQIARQAQQWGVADCLNSIARISEFLTTNMTYSWRAQRGTTDPNREIFGATIAAREQGSGLQGLSGLFAAPVGDGRCNAGYQTTVYVAETCARVRETVFPTFINPVEFGDIAAAFTTADGTATLYLLPAGPSGCVAIKSELFY
jgi:hypothetical protein